MPAQSSTTYAIPAAIVIAGALIAGAVLFVNFKGEPAPITGGTNTAAMRPISAEDHILGNPNAPIKIVEYSDTECPFCKNFHSTMRQVMDTYGKEGKVAWIYRHFPIPSLHSKAPHEAEALECAGELGGETKFWEYTNKIYEITPSNDGLDTAQLPQIAESIGLNRAAFTACLDSGKHKDRVDRDAAEAMAIGALGTPHSIIIAGGEQVPLEGAQPYSVMSAFINTVLKQETAAN